MICVDQTNPETTNSLVLSLRKEQIMLTHAKFDEVTLEDSNIKEIDK